MHGARADGRVPAEVDGPQLRVQSKRRHAEAACESEAVVDERERGFVVLHDVVERQPLARVEEDRP
jgi:hypothetical protein